MHRIDVHHHIVPPTYVSTVGAARVFRQTGRPAPPSAGWTVEKSLEQMDSNGVATALTSVSAPGTWFGDIEQGRRLSRECNEYAARIAADHPGRFGSLISLPMGDVE